MARPKIRSDNAHAKGFYQPPDRSGTFKLSIDRCSLNPPFIK